MEDLQQALQRILSDPEQMSQLQAMAGALGLNPDAPPEAGENAGPDGSDPEGSAAQGTTPAEPELASALPKLMAGLGSMNGPEQRVLNALRSALPPEKQGKIDKALQAARISRLAGQFLRNQS